MGKVMSMVARKANRFNVENRAHKVLEKEKPTPAPRFQSNIKDLQRAQEVDPDFMERQAKKDGSLDDRLKKVFVTSADSFIDYGIRTTDEEKKALPLSRTTPQDFEYGFLEPKLVSRGRCTLRQAMKFITDNQADPSTWSAEKIADQYKLKKEVVDQILAHFRSFEIHIPDIRQKQSILSQTKQKLLNKKNET